MPLVYSYYDPIAAIDGETEHRLVTLWKNSWRACDFIPVLLSHQHAEAHPLYEQFVKKIDEFPSVNPKGYDRACWLRWLAFDVVKGGLTTDYDVIARAFSPEDLSFCPNHVNVLDRGGVPCAVFATSTGASLIVQDILEHKPEHDGRHYSDMFFFQARNYPKVPQLTAPFGAEAWTLAPAVHFSHFDVSRERPGRSRVEVIKKEMGL